MRETTSPSRARRGSSDEIGALTTEFNRVVSQVATYDDHNVRRLVSEQQKSDAILRSLDPPDIL